LLSPLSQNTIEKEMVLDDDNDDSDNSNVLENLPVLDKPKPSKKTEKKAKKVVSDVTAKKTRHYIDDSSTDELYCDDDVDDSNDDSDDDGYNDDVSGIDDEVGDDVLSIEDDSDDDGDWTPICYSQLSEHDKKLWDANKKIEILQGRTTECTTGTGRNKKKLVWTVISDHQPVNPVHTLAFGSRKSWIVWKNHSCLLLIYFFT
jgi:hypothetical protein